MAGVPALLALLGEGGAGAMAARATAGEVAGSMAASTTGEAASASRMSRIKGAAKTAANNIPMSDGNRTHTRIGGAPTHGGAAYGARQVRQTQFSGFGALNLNMGVRGTTSVRPTYNQQQTEEAAPDPTQATYRRMDRPTIGSPTQRALGPGTPAIGPGPRAIGPGPRALGPGTANNLPVISGGGASRYPNAIETTATTRPVPLYRQTQPSFKQGALF